MVLKIKLFFKIDNEIITSIDIENEKNYLIALNPNLKNLMKKKLSKYQKDPLLEKNKKNIELAKRLESTNINKAFWKI